MSNSLNPDHFVGPGLGPNCSQKLQADDTSRQSERVYYCLSHDVASGSEIKPYNKIDKRLVVYRFNNVT